MSELTYTLLAEGSSDRALLPILSWLLHEMIANRAIQPLWADLWRLPERPRGLAERIERSVELYPCDLLFVHRDGDNEGHEARSEEIRIALASVSLRHAISPVVCVIPIRAQEAWLLLDEMAIRRAVGNPNGIRALTLPPPRRVETLPDPKQTLYDLLKVASELSPRRLRSFRPATFAPRVSEHIGDFNVLRTLPAFAALERDLLRVVHEQGWHL